MLISVVCSVELLLEILFNNLNRHLNSLTSGGITCEMRLIMYSCNQFGSSVELRAAPTESIWTFVVLYIHRYAKIWVFSGI